MLYMTVTSTVAAVSIISAVPRVTGPLPQLLLLQLPRFLRTFSKYVKKSVKYISFRMAQTIILKNL